MHKREAKFQVKFNHWLKHFLKEIFVFKIPDCGYQNPFDVFSVDADGKFSAWELKQTTTDSLPFSAVVDHQVQALSIVDGFVVIKYPKSTVVITITTWINEIAVSKRKSLTYKQALELSTYSIDV